MAIPGHAGFELAARIERAEAASARFFAEGAGDEVVSIAGGVMIFAGANSPLTHVVGAGMSGPVPPRVIDEIEAFYKSRGANPEIEVTPHADHDYIVQLVRRGYVPDEFQNVMACALPANLGTLDEHVRRVGPEYADTYAEVGMASFFPDQPLTPELLRICRSLALESSYLAFNGERPVACGGMRVFENVAHLFGDGTLLAARGQGWQQAIIRARVAHAMEAGCDLATASTLPGSTSQRNYERCGFQVVYTKLIMRRPL